ncbi:hypothetical protein AA21291_1884 [Swaminathania salitolerans LMG 21291]|uniref:DUF58 domain-containing protein n=2 Tax=Swaminathania salitolerans TaxID=182838 RepID=A0A511BRW9_9PROT|nr:hypothetical protein AA21291_1884 [Swaminathania salitolerans LMG 21291]GEL03076.1 hypothetical protein SSA02_22390 [Swaminathania salitolerans]
MGAPGVDSPGKNSPGKDSTGKDSTGMGASGRKAPLAAVQTLAPQAESLLPPMTIEAERIGRQIRAGVHRQHRPGSGEDFWQYRPAHAHEPAQHIDWRQSARGEQLWVREREAEGAQHLALWCDSSPSMRWRSRDALPFKLDRARLCTLALAAAALHGGERVSLPGTLDPCRVFSGTHTLPQLAETLLSSGYRGSADTGQTGEDVPLRVMPDTLRPHGQLVLVSDFLLPPEALERLLRDVASRPARTRLFCVLDPAERALPYTGRQRFESLEAEDALILPSVESLADAYGRAMDAHIDHVARLAAQYRATLTLHQTDQPVLPALLALYAELTGGRLHP